jgi:cell division protein ZapA
MAKSIISLGKSYPSWSTATAPNCAPAEPVRKKNPIQLYSALQFRSMSAPVKVQIFGQVYSIRGELEEKYVQKLAKCVDEKMHAIAEATGIVDTQKLAVLAALAIADELHSLKTELSDEEELLREQAERCLTLVERALKQTA